MNIFGKVFDHIIFQRYVLPISFLFSEQLTFAHAYFVLALVAGWSPGFGTRWSEDQVRYVQPTCKRREGGGGREEGGGMGGGGGRIG